MLMSSTSQPEPSPPGAGRRYRPDAGLLRRRNQHEFRLQCFLVGQFRALVDRRDAVIVALENGEDRSEETLDRLYAKGLEDGIPDLQVIRPNGWSLWIEVKLETNLKHMRSRLSDSQRQFHAMLEGFGHPVVTVRNADEFWAAIDAAKIPHRAPPPLQPALFGQGRL